MPRLQRNQTPDSSLPTPTALLEENQQLMAALEQAQATQTKLRELIEQITAAPWFPALFQKLVDTPQGMRAMVWVGAMPRLVNLHPSVDGPTLPSGSNVYLDHEQATLMAAAKGAFVTPTESATFERLTQDGRVVVRSRDEEIVLERAACLDDREFRSGSKVLFDRPSRIALETMDGVEGKQYQLEDLGELSRGDVGGHAQTLDDLISLFSASLVEPELARLYRMTGRRAALMYGPPGCGKTLMAKTAAAEIQRMTGKRCRFAVVRPGEFESSYVGESEANIRACFRSLREAAGDDMAVLFLDEIESIGRIRGGAGGRHQDRFLAALLAEIDGFCERGKVSILAATNRRDLLDPALLSRLADTQIAVPRPNLQAAREILAIQLPVSLPYYEMAEAEADGQSAAEARSRVIETAISRLYPPNADNEVSRLTLRDGTQRTVHARELMSGRLLDQIALSIREKAFRRHVAGDDGGLRIPDALAAVETCLAELSTTLTVHNARAYLDDLPQDVDVVRVEPIRTKPERRHRYYNAA
ncbi:MAG: AAA family ATPase [bacterium]|nr:AAA family ATPase [bacterium]